MKVKSINILIYLFLYICLGTATAKDRTIKEFNILKYGAKPDGITLNTVAIQKTIDAAYREGGGKVIVPEGVFLTGPIVLKSNIDFHVEKGGVILGSTKVADYRTSVRQNEVARALIYAEGVSNLSITGEGIIDGQGRLLAHHQDSLFHIGQWEHYNYDCKIPEGRIKNTEIRKSKNITIQGVTFQKANEWTFHAQEVGGLTITKVRINSDEYWNNDGLDITDCKDVFITGCDVNAADDGICLKSENSSMWNDNILIENCRVRSSASAVKFGTSSYGGFKNVTVRDIEVYDTYRSAIALECVDGGILENILIEDFNIKNTGNAIFVRLGKRTVNDDKQSILKNVTIRNMKAQIAYGRPDGNYQLQGPPVDGFYNTFPASITGVPGLRPENIRLENIEITMPGKGNDGLAWIPLYRLDSVPEKEDKYPEYDMFRELPAWAMYVRHVDNIEFKNVKFIAQYPDYRPAYVFDDVDNLTMKDISIIENDDDQQIILRNVRNENVESDKKLIRVIPAS